jgi:HlyD family secretion protein
VDGKTRFQPVATGIDTLEGQTEIVKGLAPGDEVVVYSPTDLLEGMKVKVARVRD